MKSIKIDFTRIYPFIFSIVFVVITFQYNFSSFEAFFYDFRITEDVFRKSNDQFVTVRIDEESDEFLGETYPYTYASHNRFVQRLIRDRPKAVVFFVTLNDPTTLVETQSLLRFKSHLDDFIGDGGLFRFGTDMDAWGEQIPPQSLQELGYSLALLNIDNAIFAKDDTARRAILSISGEQSLHLWLANSLKVKAGLPEVKPSSFKGAYYKRDVEARFALFRYFEDPTIQEGAISSIPYHRVSVGNFRPGFFTDKIVLIGSQYISNPNNFVLTPFNKEELKSSKLNVHANIIQAFYAGKTIIKLPRIYSEILAITLAVILSIIISRSSPARGLLIIVLSIITTLVLCYLLLCLFGIWIYVSHLFLTIFIVYYIWVPFRAIAEYQTRYKIQEETRILKKVDHLKQNFISLMSHDLKTPVAKIAGVADILATQFNNSSSQQKHLERIIDSTKELNRFITSILDLTKIESRNIALKLKAKDINKTITEIVEKLIYEAERKNIKIMTDLGPLYPIQIDVDLMKRVMSNLVENAIKYSGDGSQVSIRSWDDEKFVYIEIADNGVGIPQEEQKHIFEKFYRVKNDSTHSIKGSGLGLYLVRYFIELHGGSISVKSEMKKGTTFTISLKNQ